MKAESRKKATAVPVERFGREIVTDPAAFESVAETLRAWHLIDRVRTGARTVAASPEIEPA